MRVKPTPAIALAIFVAYGIFLILALQITGVDYDEIGDSTGNLIKGVVVPIGVGSILLAALTSRLGWWRPAVHEESKAGPRWLLVVPALLLLTAVANIVDNGFGGNVPGLLLVLAVGVIFVGFSEELLTRGLMLVGFRGSLPEVYVWFLTSALFGLLHGINFISGQGAADTFQQMGFAFAFGSVLYLVRRLAGTLVVCMALHAFWDFSVIATTTGPAVAATDTAPGIGQLLILPMVLIAAYGLFKVLRQGRQAAPVPDAAGAR